MNLTAKEVNLFTMFSELNSILQDKGVDSSQLIGVEVDGVFIIDLIYDEFNRFEVDPIRYYGEMTCRVFVNQVYREYPMLMDPTITLHRYDFNDWHIGFDLDECDLNAGSTVRGTIKEVLDELLLMFRISPPDEEATLRALQHSLAKALENLNDSYEASQEPLYAENTIRITINGMHHDLILGGPQALGLTLLIEWIAYENMYDIEPEALRNIAKLDRFK